MKIVLVRHGEPDYSRCINMGYFGLGLNLAPLSARGCEQAETVAKSTCMQHAQLIVSSPYTRALQTAAVISRVNNIPLSVNEDLYEWVPDLSYKNRYEDETKLSDEFLSCGGLWPNAIPQKWEPIDLLSQRVLNALSQYRKYQKIIIVCHAVIMFHLTGLNTIPYCCTTEIEFDEKFTPAGWFTTKNTI